MKENMPAPTHLTVLVPEEASPQGKAADESGAFEARGGVRDTLRSLVFREKTLPLDKVQSEIARLDAEVGSFLATITATSVAGYQLNEVQVQVGVSAQGSIGVVTAGVQGSLTLVYARGQAHTG